MSMRGLITDSSIRYGNAHEQLIHRADATLHEQIAPYIHVRGHRRVNAVHKQGPRAAIQR